MNINAQKAAEEVCKYIPDCDQQDFSCVATLIEQHAIKPEVERYREALRWLASEAKYLNQHTHSLPDSWSGTHAIRAKLGTAIRAAEQLLGEK